MRPRLSVPEISQRLAENMESLARELLGEPNRALSTRRELRFGSKGSLSVVLARPKRGEWFDHEADKGGRAFGLVQREIGKPGARAWALRWLGIDEPQGRNGACAAPAVIEPSRDAAGTPGGAPLGREEPPAEGKPADTMKAARQMQLGFLSRCVPASEETPTALYLRRRGITGPIPDVLRSANSGDPQDGKLVLGLAYWEDGLEKDFLPAMIAEIAQPDGTVAGVHVTYLRPDGSGKADVLSPKKMHGIKKGGAVRLTAAGPVLAVTEGIETGLSILGARPDLAVWAALDAGNLKALQLPDDVREVLICADNDASRAGQKAAQAAADRWMSEGREVSIALPPQPGTDFNDVLLQDGVAAVRALLERAEAWRGIAPHYDVEPMNVGAAFAALEMEVRGFVDREAIRAEVPQAQEEAVRQALAAHPELDPAVTLSALISPVTAEAHERLVARAKQQARKAVLTKHGLRRLPQRERLQIAASAGIGKTKAVIDAIAAKNAPLVVNVFVPTHKLAGGLADRFEQPGVRAYVIRGRTAAGAVSNDVGIAGGAVSRSLRLTG